jgi:hypothetical protein
VLPAVPRAGRVRLAGDVDELRQRHRVSCGPAGWPGKGGWQVISSASQYWPLQLAAGFAGLISVVLTEIRPR